VGGLGLAFGLGKTAKEESLFRGPFTLKDQLRDGGGGGGGGSGLPYFESHSKM